MLLENESSTGEGNYALSPAVGAAERGAFQFAPLLCVCQLGRPQERLVASQWEVAISVRVGDRVNCPV